MKSFYLIFSTNMSYIYFFFSLPAVGALYALLLREEFLALSLIFTWLMPVTLVTFHLLLLDLRFTIKN
jgi:hypothetical protein